jgi:hypothetical protein
MLAPFLASLCEDPSLRVVPRSPPLLLADDDPSPCLLESYDRQAEGFGPAFRSVRAGWPQGEESRTVLEMTPLVSAGKGRGVVLLHALLEARGPPPKTMPYLTVKAMRNSTKSPPGITFSKAP